MFRKRRNFIMKGTFDKETIEFSVSFYNPYQKNNYFNIRPVRQGY